MKDKALQIAQQLQAYRRDIHMQPEIGFKEEQTADKVATILEGLGGYRVRRGVARTGVIAERGHGKPVIAIRADMDALPIQEANDVPYVSRVPGMMHACGHDAHTAIGLGVATLLNDEAFTGTVRLLFQPSEDSDDEHGVSGAPRMIQAGAVEGADAILGLHVHAGTEAGLIRMCPGTFLAGADLFKATIFGAGGHGGAPHETIDPIHLASQVIVALNAIVSRRIASSKIAVISLGTIHGGTADTVIPNKVELSGTVRYASLEVRKTLHDEMERAFSIARTLGGDYSLDIKAGSSPTVNDPQLVSHVLKATEDLFGKSQIQEHEPVMYGDDFSHYGKIMPAGFFFVGAEIKGDRRKHHDAHFDIDESCMPVAVAVLAETVLRMVR